MLDLAFSGDDARVVGVIVQDRDGGSPPLLPADLVVDATGRVPDAGVARASRLPPPRGERARGQALRDVPGPARPRRLDRLGDAVASQPGLRRGGIMLAQEGDSRVVSLVGRFGEQPPPEPEFLAWARTLDVTAGRGAGRELEPLDEGATYRFPANRRRHYEGLTSFPRLVVVGDALCAFDPVYGQGMTVAAIEAVALGRCLQQEVPELATRFHRGRRDHRHALDHRSRRRPDGDGRVPWRSRLVEAYLARLLDAGSRRPGPGDRVPAGQPSGRQAVDLMHPALARRVLRHSLPRSRRWGGGGGGGGPGAVARRHVDLGRTRSAMCWPR